MRPSPRILTVDDELEHLEMIQGALNALGHATLPLLYPDLIRNGAFKALSAVRIVFMDIELLSDTIAGNPKQNYSAIVSILERCLSPTNGPYILIFWTDNPGHYNDVTSYVSKNITRMLRPFIAGHLDKMNYQDGAGDLNGDVKRIIVSSPPVWALLNWEQHILNGTGEVLSIVMDLLGEDPLDPAQLTEQLAQILSRLATQAVGVGNVRSQRLEAVNNVLLPILDDCMQDVSLSSSDRTLWKKATNRLGSADPLTAADRAKINTRLHIITNVFGIRPKHRGAVIEPPKSWTQAKGFKLRFGILPSEAKKREFGVKGILRARWVIVQSQAACDYAQRQSGPLPFLLGLVVPTSVKLINENQMKDSLWRSPELELFGDISRVHVNQRFTLSITAEAVKDMRVVFRMRDGLLEKLKYSFHSYSQRPGVIEF